MVDRRNVHIRVAMCVAAAIVGYQVFIPPVVGLANQGDFRRIIGRFGYGPEEGDQKTGYSFVASKYVPDPNYRLPEWEMPTSEYPFVWAALGVNRVISKDGKLDIEVMGLAHALAFLVALWRVLSVTRVVRGRMWVWTLVVLALTDVAYVAYFNSFYTEPASIIFFLFLFAESLDLLNHAEVSSGAILRWTMWAVLFVFAKPQNAPLAIFLAVFVAFLRASRLRWASAGIVLAAAGACVAVSPVEMGKTNVYDMVFSAVLAESKDRAADLRALGLDSELARYTGTLRWSDGSGFESLTANGTIGRRVTRATIVSFFLTRPKRLWRHVHAILPFALTLRTHYGNFKIPEGYPPMTRSEAFSLWSTIHARVLSPVAKWILFAFPIPALIMIIRGRNSDSALRSLALLGLCGLVSFLAAIFGDCDDNVKHLLLFNLITDAFLISSAAIVFKSPGKRVK
jgi:hypothetical protein